METLIPSSMSRVRRLAERGQPRIDRRGCDGQVSAEMPLLAYNVQSAELGSKKLSETQDDSRSSGGGGKCAARRPRQ